MPPRTRDEGKNDGRDPALSFRRNHRIVVLEVQVLSPEGKALGILPTKEAIGRALEMRLDLVEVEPEAHPPICRMMDFGKYISERAKNRPDGI